MIKKIKKYISITIITSTMNQIITPVKVLATTTDIKSQKNINIKNQKTIKKQEEKFYGNQENLKQQIASLTKKMKEIQNQIASLNKKSNENQDSIDQILIDMNSLKNEMNILDEKMKQLQEECNIVEQEVLKTIKNMYMLGGSTALMESFLMADSYQEFENTAVYAKQTVKEIQNVQEKYKAKLVEIQANKVLKESGIEKLKKEKEEIEKNVEDNNTKTCELDELYKVQQETFVNLTDLLDKCKKQSKEFEEAKKVTKKFQEKIEQQEKLADPTNEIIKIQKEAEKKDEKNQAKEPSKENPNEKDKNKDKDKDKDKRKDKPASPEKHIFPVLGPCYISQHYNPKKRHPAIDISTYGKPNPVVATKSGRVLNAGLNLPGFSGYGRIVLLLHDKGEVTLYAHLSSSLVRPGQEVKQGQQIGRVGNTGRVRGRTGVHLHHERKINGRPVPPTF